MIILVILQIIYIIDELFGLENSENAQYKFLEAKYSNWLFYPANSFKNTKYLLYCHIYDGEKHQILSFMKLKLQTFKDDKFITDYQLF